MRRSRSRSAGFTLLEVLLTLALAGVLMTAVWASLDLFFRYSDAGREEADQLQVARAISQAIERDLRSSIQPPAQAISSPSSTTPSTDSSSTESSSTETSGTTSTSSSSSQTTGSTQPAVQPLIFVGDEQAFVFQSLIPQTLEQSSLAQSAGATAGYRRDLQWIGWSASGKLPANVTSGSPIPPPPPQEEIDDRPQVIRWQTDVLGIAVEASGTPASFPVPPEVVPELLRFQIRYYNGLEWVETWASDVDGGLPLAVEIEMDVTSYAELEAVRESRRQSRPRDPEFKTHKLMIPLPISTSVRPPAAASSS